MRKLKRAIARKAMVEEGWKHLNRRQYDLMGFRIKSHFAENWRKYCTKVLLEKR